MTRPAFHVDVATTALPQNIAQPPGGIQTAGFPPHSKFASAWANWLFNYLGEWTRELDQSCIRAIDFLSDAAPQLLQGGGAGFELQLGAGLDNLLPTDGGNYIVLGRRIDLTADALADKYVTGWTLPPNATVYAHAREEIDYGGSSTGEILISTNASEVGYQAIWTGDTDGTELVSQMNLAELDLQWVQPTEMFTHLYIDDPVDEIAFSVTGSNTFAPAVYVTSVNGGAAIQADIGSSVGPAFTTTVSGADSIGVSVGMFSAPATARGILVSTDGTTLGPGIRVNNAGTDAGIVSVATGNGFAGSFTSSGGASSALNVSGGAQQAISATGSGAGAGIRAQSGGTADADGIVVTMGNTSGNALQATTAAGALDTSRALLATATGAAIAIEAIAAGNFPLTLQGDSTSPTFGELHFSGQNADPTNVFDGAMMWHNGQRQLKMSDALDGTFRGVWTSVGGRCHGYQANQVVQTTPGWNVVATADMVDSNAPKVAGRQVLLRFTCEVRNVAAGSPNVLNVRFCSPAGVAIAGSTRQGGPSIVSNTGFVMADTSQNWQRCITYTFAYTIPAAGDRTITAEVASNTAVQIVVRDACIVVEGEF